MILRQVFFSLLLSLIFISCSNKPHVLFEKESGVPTHPRGLYVKNDNSWVIAGHNGAFEIYNGFNAVLNDSIPGMEDLRDVEILNDGSIVFMNSGTKGQIWRYFPEKDSLGKAYDKEGVFLDGMSFWNDQFGIAFGDPINGRMTILRTMDSSKTWQNLDYNLIPEALDGEAGFAASGTGIATLGDSKVIIGTGGGKVARLYVSVDQGLNWEVKDTPMKSDTSYGIYSMYFWSENEGIIIGGSYKYPNDNDSICFYTADGGDTWSERTKGLGGYCSSIHGTENGDVLFATGRIGTYYSQDKGVNWELFSKEQFYSVKYNAKKIYFSGRNGRVQVVEYE